MSRASQGTIAVVGASRSRSKFGNKAVRAYRSEGWKVFPVNPAGGEIEGLPVYRRLSEVPDELDRISIYLPPEATRRLLPEVRSKGASELWLNPGSADSEVEAEAREIGLEVHAACSIVDIGRSPSEFP